LVLLHLLLSGGQGCNRLMSATLWLLVVAEVVSTQAAVVVGLAVTLNLQANL
jgi:type III secretory pathway component EscS